MNSIPFKDPRIAALWNGLLSIRNRSAFAPVLSVATFKRSVKKVAQESLGVDCVIMVEFDEIFVNDPHLLGSFDHDYDDASDSKIYVRMLTGDPDVTFTDYMTLYVFTVLVHEFTHSLQPRAIGAAKFNRLAHDVVTGGDVAYYLNPLEVDAYGREILARLMVLGQTDELFTYKRFVKWIRDCGTYTEYAKISRKRGGFETLMPLYHRALHWLKRT